MSEQIWQCPVCNEQNLDDENITVFVLCGGCGEQFEWYELRSNTDVEKTLIEMGKSGKLLELLTDDDIDIILANAPKVEVSDRFKRDARSAMWLANIERKKNKDESEAG